MKTKKTILVASSSMLAAGMAQGAITYNYVNQTIAASDPAITFDLNGDGISDYKVFFDGQNSTTKPCVAATPTGSDPTPFVLNELIMNPGDPDHNNGVPVMPLGTVITNEVNVGGWIVALGYTETDGTSRGYLYQNGGFNQVGQWPGNLSGQDTFGYVALAMVDNTLGTTNYGWVQVELNYAAANPLLTLIDYAYDDSGASILAGQRGPISVPVIYQAPTNQTVAAGVLVTMSVTAMGDPEPTYQWKAGRIGSGVYTNITDNNTFAGSDSSTLMISGAAPANQLDYVVVVSNANGSVTSSPAATLKVNVAALAGPVPPQQKIYEGYPAHFTVIDLGGLDTDHRWQRNGTDLVDGGVFSDTTTATLQISNVSPSVLGDYRAIATTAYGSVTSSVAPLSIAYPDGSPYEALVRANGAANYYRLNETNGTTAWDFIGGANGIYGADATLGATGLTPDTGFPGFVSTNYAATFQSQDADNVLSVEPWNLNTNTVTITAWIYPQPTMDTEGNAGIVFTASANNMVAGIRYDGSYANTPGADGNIGYNWGDYPSTGGWNSGITAPRYEWSLVALAISPDDATLYIINDEGVQSAVNTVGNPVLPFDATEYIGTYPREGALGNNNFSGYIDEVAIFKSTLSSNQVYALYQSAKGIKPADTSVTLTKVGSNLQLEWSSGTLMEATNIMGPWVPNTTATSPYIVNPTNAQTYFRAQ